MATRTVKPSGQGGDYTSMSAWEAGRQASLSEPEICSIEGDWSGGADTTAVTINGWTTTATNYIQVQTVGSARHSGALDMAAYRLAVTGASCMMVEEEYVHIDGLQAVTTDTSAAYVFGMSTSNGTWLGVVSNCIIKGVLSGTSGSGNGVGIYRPSSAGVIRNCIVYDWINGSNNLIGIFVGGTCSIYNNTLHNCRTGIYGGWSGPVVTNNLVQDTTRLGYDGGNYGANSLTNISGDSSSPNSAFRNKTVVFADETNDDFHLGSSDTEAIDRGTDLSASFTTDIDGDTRSGTWDIGADEYTSGSSPQTITTALATSTVTAYAATLAAVVGITTALATATVTAQTATLSASATIITAPASATATAYAATPGASVGITTALASASATGYPAIVSARVTIPTALATTTATAYAADILTAGSIITQAASVTATAYPANVSARVTIATALATTTATAYAADIDISGAILTQAASAAVTAYPATVTATVTIVTAPASATVTAYAAAFGGIANYLTIALDERRPAIAGTAIAVTTTGTDLAVTTAESSLSL
jgi:hypothetical protein